MPYTERIRLFTNKSFAKNASIVNATPVQMAKFGPNTVFGLDLNASKPGNMVLTYQIAMDADDAYYTPGNASPLNVAHKGGASTGSRDYYSPTILPAPFVKFKAKEQNASNMIILSADLIVQTE